MKRKLIKNNELFWTGFIFVLVVAPTAGNNKLLYFIGIIVILSSFLPLKNDS